MYEEYQYDQRLDEATSMILAACDRLAAEWWPTPDRDVHLILSEAILEAQRQLLRAQPTLLAQ